MMSILPRTSAIVVLGSVLAGVVAAHHVPLRSIRSKKRLVEGMLTKSRIQQTRIHT